MMTNASHVNCFSATIVPYLIEKCLFPSKLHVLRKLWDYIFWSSSFLHVIFIGCSKSFGKPFKCALLVLGLHLMTQPHIQWSTIFLSLLEYKHSHLSKVCEFSVWVCDNSPFYMRIGVQFVPFINWKIIILFEYTFPFEVFYIGKSKHMLIIGS